MTQRRVQKHQKENEALGAEPDELLTAKVSRLESEIKEQSSSLKELYVKIMETKIDSLEKQNASINLQNASINRQIIKLGKKHGLGCARLVEGYSVAIRETAAYPGIRTPENLSPNAHFVYISTTVIMF